MVIAGLTGSIGMGKSTAAAFLRRLKVPVYDADGAVHRVFSPGGEAVEPVRRAFPDAITNGAVDRAKLSRLAVDDPAVFEKLERIVHPIVRRAQERFLTSLAVNGATLAALDIPLLFETGGDRRCDATIVVSAPAHVQRARVLGRSGMTEAKFRAILARQLPDSEKRRRADYVVPTNQGMAKTFHCLKAIVAELRSRPGTHWPYNPNLTR